MTRFDIPHSTAGTGRTRVPAQDPDPAADSRPRRGWRARRPEWVPYLAVVWSFGVAVMALVWALTGRGYPLGANSSSEAVSAFAGIPPEAGSWMFFGGAVVAGLLSLAAARGWTTGRHHAGRWNIAGVAILGMMAVILLILVPDSQLLVMLGYAPIFLVGAPFGWPPINYFDDVTWTLVFQLLSVVGGLLLAATALAWRRRARNACTSCGRREQPSRWTTPEAAISWGRWATVVAVIVPSAYAIDRLAWVVGIPLGISQEFLDSLRSSDSIVAAFGLGTFAALGAVLTLGLVQRWGEVFPRWMIGLAGRRVPPLLAEVPATLVAILVTSATAPLVIGVAGIGEKAEDVGWIQSVILGAFPVWGVALAAATMAYHFRRRGSCDTCHRG